jgi:hypothetical protein
MLLCATPEETPKALAKVDPRLPTLVVVEAGMGGGCFTLGDDEGNTATLIWIDRASSLAEKRLYVTHEAFHATSGLLRMRGLKLKESSDEAFAYHHTWLVKKVLSLL